MFVHGEIFERIARFTRLDEDIYNGPLTMLKDNNYLTDEEVNLITSETDRVERFDILSKMVIDKGQRGMFQCFKHSLLRHYPWIVDQIDEAFFLSKFYWYHILKTTGASLKAEVPTLQNIAWTKTLNTYLPYLYNDESGDEELQENLKIIKHLMKLGWRTTVSFYHLQPETLKLEMEIWADASLPEILKSIEEKKYKIVKFVDETKERGGHGDNLTEFVELIKKYTPYSDRLKYETSFRQFVIIFVDVDANN